LPQTPSILKMSLSLSIFTSSIRKERCESILNGNLSGKKIILLSEYIYFKERLEKQYQTFSPEK
jgi:hypothetical protein